MNFRNKYLVITLRTLWGLFMIFSGVTGLMAGAAATGIPEPMVPITQALWKSGIFQMIKVTEIVAGLMLVTSFLPWLAAIFLAPLSVGVLVFNGRISPEFLPAAAIVALLNIYFGYVYWDKYKGLFQRK